MNIFGKIYNNRDYKNISKAIYYNYNRNRYFIKKFSKL